MQDTDVFACVGDSDKGTAFERWRDFCLRLSRRWEGLLIEYTLFSFPICLGRRSIKGGC